MSDKSRKRSVAKGTTLRSAGTALLSYGVTMLGVNGEVYTGLLSVIVGAALLGANEYLMEGKARTLPEGLSVSDLKRYLDAAGDRIEKYEQSQQSGSEAPQRKGGK